MSDVPEAAPDPCEPDIDENGVDLAQIRAMLDLTPAERLSQVARFAGALLEIRTPSASSTAWARSERTSRTKT